MSNPAKEDSNKNRCHLCGKDPADGYAMIQDQRYCHGDEAPSCYLQAGRVFLGLYSLVIPAEEGTADV